MSGETLEISTRKTADRDIVNIKSPFEQRLYEFRVIPNSARVCGDCGSLVMPEWEQHHAKWHWNELSRTFSGF